MTPVKCTKSAHRGTRMIYDSCHFDIGHFHAKLPDLRKVSTSEWYSCISQTESVPTITCSLRYMYV